VLSCPCVYLVGIAVTSVTLSSTLRNKQGKVGSVTQYSLQLTDGAPANPVGLTEERSTIHAVPRNRAAVCFPQAPIQTMGQRGSRLSHPSCTMAVALWRGVFAADLGCEKAPGMLDPRGPCPVFAGYRGLRLTEVKFKRPPRR
jgi:hypothetical protein